MAGHTRQKAKQFCWFCWPGANHNTRYPKHTVCQPLHDWRTHQAIQAYMHPCPQGTCRSNKYSTVSEALPPPCREGVLRGPAVPDMQSAQSTHCQDTLCGAHFRSAPKSASGVIHSKVYAVPPTCFPPTLPVITGTLRCCSATFSAAAASQGPKSCRLITRMESAGLQVILQPEPEK